MKWKIALAGLLLWVSCISAQPANDDCANATPLMLSMPGGCPAGAPAVDVFSGDNTGATPITPYPVFAGCSGGTNDGPASEVWYYFDAEVRTILINVTGNLNTPNAILYNGDECEFLSPVACGKGTAGSGSLSFLASVNPGRRYYLMVSGESPADQGTFDIQMTSFSDCDACQNINELVASPPPVNGTYSTGQEVTFCYTVNQWDLTDKEWLHAIEVAMGPGWDLSTIQPVVPESCDGFGQWSWYNSWTSNATGRTYGPGFAYDSNNPTPPTDGNPGNNWGDGDNGCDSIGTSSPAREFCFTIRTVSSCPATPAGNDLSVQFTVYSDGETGSWFQTGCNNNTSDFFLSSLNCCNDRDPAINNVQLTTCREQCDGSFQMVGSGGIDPGTWDYTVFDDQNNVIFQADNQTGPVTIDNLCSGRYSALAVNVLTNCSRSRQVIIGEGPPPPAVADNSGPFCRWGTIELLGSTPDSGSVITYSWEGPGGYTSNQQNPTDPTTDGDYVLTVEVDGCLSDPDTTTVSYLPDSIPAFPVPTQCSATDTLLDLNSFLTDTFAGNWSEISALPSQGGAFDAAAGTFNPFGQAGAVYSFAFVPDSAQACATTPSLIDVEVAEGPASVAGPDQTISCTNPSVIIGTDSTASGPGVRYRWTYQGTANVLFDQNSRTTEVNQPGTYTLEVSDTSGCPSISTVNVVADTALPIMDILSQNISCFGEIDGQISVPDIQGGTPPYTFSFDGAETGGVRDFFNLPAGTYELRVVDSSGCEATAQVQIEEPEEFLVGINANLPSPFVLRLGDSVRLSAVINPGMSLSTIRWAENNALLDSLSATVTASPTSNTVYQVAASNSEGCIARNEIIILVDGRQAVYVPTAFSPNNDGNNDLFKPFVGPEIQQVKLFQVYDRWGELVYGVEEMSPFDTDLGWDGRHAGRNMNSGVYVYRFVGERLDGTLVDDQGEVTLVR